METPDLDAIDRKILRELQHHGRVSNVDLAAQVHLSAPQCFRRVRALEERGDADQALNETSGDAIAADFERYLREQHDE